MRGMRGLCVFVSVLALSMASCMPPGSSAATTCRESIDGVRALTQDLGLPDHFLQGNPTKTSEDFDVNSLLSALDHLTVTQGYTLDFVYFADGLGGKPVIYSRAIDETPYATYSEFIEAAGGASYWEQSYGPLEHAHDYLEFVETDDRPDGYLQFVMMATVGDQFYLQWHSLYHDEVIMCDVSDVEKAVEEVQGFDIELPESIIARARALDLEPTVHLDEETATVRFVLFTKWGGFIEVWHTLSREFPHMFVDGGSEVLIEYDCGINF